MKNFPLFKLLPEPLDDRAARTFAYDCLRQALNGLTDTGPKTFFLLVAVQRFSAGDFSKALISMPASAGMAVSVFLLPWLSRSRLPKTTWLAWARVLSALCFLLAAWKPSLQTYAFWIFLGGLPSNIVYPLLTSLYHENYPRRVRGQLFAWATMVNMGSSALSHWIIGLWLGRNSLHYRGMLAAFGIAALLSALTFARMPAQRHPRDRSRSFVHAFKWVRSDKPFAYMLLVWSVFGFATFLVGPLKVLYLTEPRYGLMYAAATVALIVGIIPEFLRISSTPVWAWLFDRHDFVSVRMALNVLLFASMAAFFLGRTMAWLYAAAALEGLFSGGANIAWALWVTRVAPKGHTAEYMSVNQCFTGLRGMVGTFVGIRLASAFGLTAVAYGALGLVLLSVVMMIPVRGAPQWRKPESGGGVAQEGIDA